MRPVTLEAVRRFAIARSLFPPTTLTGALQQLKFVQADPIRAPARAQDLTLRHRVGDYRAGDLERGYASLDVEEDIFINYGFVTREVQALMHPRTVRPPWTAARRRRALALLEFVRERGTVHPRDVDARFSHGTVTNYWGGSSNATTHLMEDMHYRGLLRVARREGGVRIYAPQEHAPAPEGAADRRARVDAIVDVVVHTYAPLPATCLSKVVGRLRYAVPQWHGELRGALERAKHRLTRARVDGVEWYWPAGESVTDASPDDAVRLLSPFDPVVWDRSRFERLWGWPYRFEAYTPAAKRAFGYYSLPLLWRDHAIGWGNVSVTGRELRLDVGYVASAAPRERSFRRALEKEHERLRAFLGLDG